LLQDIAAHFVAKRHLVDKVNVATEQLVQFGPHAAAIPQGGRFCEAHKEVDVAVVVGIAARDGTEDSDVTRASPGCDFEDGLAMLSNQIDHAESIMPSAARFDRQSISRALAPCASFSMPPSSPSSRDCSPVSLLSP
jgi:hypothetical protein